MTAPTSLSLPKVTLLPTMNINTEALLSSNLDTKISASNLKKVLLIIIKEIIG